MGASSPTSGWTLLSIPAEIRWMIYPQLFQGIRIKCDRRTRTFDRSTSYWLHLETPSEFEILMTCRQIYEEALEHLYGLAVFDLNDLVTYDHFFNVLPPFIRKHVRSVEGVKITRGVQTYTTASMKPAATELHQWLADFENLLQLTLTVDTVVTLQDDTLGGIPSLDSVTFDDVFQAITSPFTSTGRPRWSLQPLVDLIEANPQIDFIVILKLRTVAARLRGVKSIDKVLIHFDVRRRTFQLADSSFNDGVFAGKEPTTQAQRDRTQVPTNFGRRVAYTRGGIFAW